MNRKQLALLVALLIVLGGAVLLVQRNSKTGTEAGGEGAEQKLLGANFPATNVAHISLKQGSDEVNLVRKDDVWHVREREDYPANFSQISQMVQKMADLKVMRSEEVGPSQLAGLRLAPPGQGTNSALVVDFRDKDDKSIKTVWLGKFHEHKLSAAQKAQFGDEGGGYPDGRYVMLADNPKALLLVGDQLENAQPKPADWLDKDFFKVERPKLIAVAWPVETNSWKIARDSETNAWQLADLKPGENADSNKFAGLAVAFASASFNDVTNAKPEETGLDKPAVVSIQTLDGFNYTIKVGRKLGEEYPLTLAVTADFPKEREPVKDEKPEDKDKADKAWKEHQKQLTDKLAQTKAFEKWTYLVPAWSLDNLLKERKDLLVEKKEEPKADAAAEKKDDAKPVDKVDLAPGSLDLVPNKRDKP